MALNDGNYYSLEADREFMSVSQYKVFAGTYGKPACEFRAMEKLADRWEDEMTTAMKVGSYVDSYFEGTLARFKAEHPEMYKQDGELKADFQKAEKIINRIEKDPYFMKFMGGKKQVIMTGELFGARWKIKMDSYLPGIAIVDLKVMSSLTEVKWVKDLGYLDFVRYWGYDIQGAVYQEIVRQNTGNRLPFYIAAVSKEKEPDIQIIQVTQDFLEEAMSLVATNMPRILNVKEYGAEPDRCELCDCCRASRVLTAPISISELLGKY